MFHTLKLLLPALIPSWRFFDEIGPSPRIEFALLAKQDDEPAAWAEFRPRPTHISVKTMLRRMVWNPRWNETLFMVSCAERLMDKPTQHSDSEIFDRICAELSRAGEGAAAFLVFRLVYISRNGTVLEKEITYISRPRPRSEPRAGAAQ